MRTFLSGDILSWVPFVLLLGIFCSRTLYSKDGSRSEHAVLSLCNATNYPKDCGFLPYNWIAVGEDVKTRCQKNSSMDGVFPIATFKWVKMPTPNQNFHRFYDGGHSAIFLGCLKEGGILVADQWCGSPFAVRKTHPDDLTRYFEIGSYSKNPHRVGFLNSAHYALKSFVYGLAKTVEDVIHIKGHASPITHSIKDWQWTGQIMCFPALFGSFHQQMLPQPNSICCRFEEFHFNDHGCYQGTLQLLAVEEEFKEQLFLSMPFEVCPLTLDYKTHQLFHENEFKSEFGYSKSTNTNMEKCTSANTRKKRYAYTGCLINDANQSHAIDIFLFVDYLDCQLQLDIIDENGAIKPSSMNSCKLCESYVFPAKFAKEQCHVSSIVNGSGEIAVVCHCLQWVNEYTTHGDKCFQGELVIQRNTLWKNFVAPTEYYIYPFDVCANIRRNQPLPCEMTSYVDYCTTADFLFSCSNRKTSVNISFVVSKECRLHIMLKQNGTALKFKDRMSWGYDERVPTEYNDSRCNVGSTRESDTKNRICFKFGESRFQDYCFRGVIVLQKSVIDAGNRTMPESAIPVTYELCAPPSPTGLPKLFTSYKEQCIQVNEIINRSLGWRNITGEGHIENLEIQIVRNVNCELKLYGVWRGENFRITFGDTNVKMEHQRSLDRTCLGREYMICFTLPQQRSTNMGCIGGSLHWFVMEIHATDFHRLLTGGDEDFKACPHVCNINND